MLTAWTRASLMLEYQAFQHRQLWMLSTAAYGLRDAGFLVRVSWDWNGHVATKDTYRAMGTGKVRERMAHEDVASDVLGIPA
jgi:hypothetical protein